MSPLAITANSILATGTLIGDIVLIIVFVAWVTGLSRSRTLAGQLPFLVRFAPRIIPVTFFLVLISVAMTLFYSEVIGYLPCGLCWFQRIFLYPQLVLLGIAWWKKDTSVADYITGLSIAGFVIAAYQYWLQLGGSTFITCPAAGATECARIYVFAYGYITMPIMSLTVFTLLILLMRVLKSTLRSS